MPLCYMSSALSCRLGMIIVETDTAPHFEGCTWHFLECTVSLPLKLNLSVLLMRLLVCILNKNAAMLKINSQVDTPLASVSVYRNSDFTPSFYWLVLRFPPLPVVSLCARKEHL